MSTQVGVPRESLDGERRVALVPKIVEKLVGRGLAVVVEPGAGAGALIPDELYTAAGASIGDPWSADVVVKVNPPTDEEIGKLRAGGTLIGFLAPRTKPELVDALRAAEVTGVRHGGHPADLPGAVHGRAVLAGERRRLQVGAAGRRAARPGTSRCSPRRPAR